MRMTIKIELIEETDGHIKSRVATGVDTKEGSTLPSLNEPTHALLDHMFRKMDEAMTKAKEDLKSQCKLQAHLK